jgi:flagellar protein FlgJ
MSKVNLNSFPIADSLQKSKSGELKKLDKVTKEFEQIFVNLILKEMNKNLGNTGFLDGGAYEKMFRDMLTQERAKQMVESGRLGIADMMYKQLEGLVSQNDKANDNSESIAKKFDQVSLERMIHDYRTSKGNQGE